VVNAPKEHQPTQEDIDNASRKVRLLEFFLSAHFLIQISSEKAKSLWARMHPCTALVPEVPSLTRWLGLPMRGHGGCLSALKSQFLACRLYVFYHSKIHFAAAMPPSFCIFRLTFGDYYPHQEKSNLLDSLNELDFHLIHLNFWTLLDSRTFKTTKTTKMQLRCN
jgi:hypothetical protein